MKKNIFENIHVQYIPGEDKHWTGRKSNPLLGKQYWYQAIELGNIHQITTTTITKQCIGLFGYQCEEGVRRNFGRVGAVHAPQLIKEKLAKLAFHIKQPSVIDFGDLLCLDQDMESCQKAFSTMITTALEHAVFPIGIGGGHDISYAHFMGIRNALKNKERKKVGIINFDAHFDLRPIEDQSNSGTPFKQIIDELKKEEEKIDYMVLGIQSSSNTSSLFEIAQNENVMFVPSWACDVHSKQINKIEAQLNQLLERNDFVYITIDMDGFSSAYAPGVSAPSPLGFDPKFVFHILQILFDSKKVIACDIAEMNPVFDQDHHTASLAARLIDFIIASYSE